MFSCGATKHDWSAQDDPRSEKWHFIDCELVLGTDIRNQPIIQDPISFVDTNTLEHDNVSDGSSNVPLPRDEDRESYRLLSFRNFPLDSWADPCHLARHGWLYLGNKDGTKCFSCGATKLDWSALDEPRSRKWHSRDCELVLGTDNRNKLIIDVPVLFVDPDESQISSASNQEPQHLAAVSSADRDIYQDKQLESSEKCEYMLRCKGIAYVREVVARFPDVERPSIKHSRFDVHTGQLIDVQPANTHEIAPMDLEIPHQRDIILSTSGTQAPFLKRSISMPEGKLDDLPLSDFQDTQQKRKRRKTEGEIIDEELEENLVQHEENTDENLFDFVVSMSNSIPITAESSMSCTISMLQLSSCDSGLTESEFGLSAPEDTSGSTSLEMNGLP